MNKTSAKTSANEALKMAIDVFEQFEMYIDNPKTSVKNDELYKSMAEAIQACKKALEHTAPSWQGLSQHEINNIGVDCQENDDVDLWKFARAIEQALKEKNT